MAVKKKTPGRVSRAEAIVNRVNSLMDAPVVRRGSDEYFKVVKIPTGSLSIDRITGGGFARGRHVELFGHYAAGKTYVLLKTMALAQQRGEICALVDPEKVFDPAWFKHLGGNPAELILFQPEKEWNAEDAIGIMMILADLVDDEEVAVVGVDSISAMVTKEEMAKDPREGDDRVATQARMMSRALRRITTMNKKTLFIWTNQERSNIGHAAIFQPTVGSGGRAMSFYATTRIEFKKASKIKVKKKVAQKYNLSDKEIQVGTWVQVRAEKEKSTKPYMQASFIFDNENGRIDQVSEIMQLGLEDGVIERHGNTFSYDALDGETWSGTEAVFRKQLIENDDVVEELVDCISDMTVELTKAGDE